jgi:hypothetical protein
LYFRQFLLDQTLQFGWIELGFLAEPHRLFAGGRMDDRADEIIALARIQSSKVRPRDVWIAGLATRSSMPVRFVIVVLNGPREP